jgi:hypothetical protein
LVGNANSGPKTLNHWFNTAAFAPQPLFQIGNVGRNTLSGPGLWDVDFSMDKNVALPWEHAMLQFRAEFFNIFNHPNSSVRGSTLGTGSFGVISSTGNALPWNIQFALQLDS